MANKRQYKTLTKKQTASVKRYTKQGKSQQWIAHKIGIAKQSIATAQRKAKIGKRVTSPFWKDVKAYKELSGEDHKRATQMVKQTKKWGTKRAARAGKKWKSYQERQAEMKKLRKEFEGEELTDKLTYEMEEYQYGDTPR